jgi:hypothetical protein
MVISGKAYWTSIASPNTTFDPDGVWTIDVGNLDKNSIDQLKTDGLTVKNKGDDRGDFVTIKRKVRRKDGQMNRTPDLVDAKKRQMTDTMIGNGSDVNVLYGTYDWEFKGRTGTSADLKSIQVTNLIPFSSGTEEEFDEVEGYADKSASPSEAFV